VYKEQDQNKREGLRGGQYCRSETFGGGGGGGDLSGVTIMLKIKKLKEEKKLVGLL